MIPVNRKGDFLRPDWCCKQARNIHESAIHMVFLVMNLMVLYMKKVKAFFVALLDIVFERAKRAFGKRILKRMAA